SVVQQILVDRWNKSSTLNCLAHSLNPRLPTTTTHQDDEISRERKQCLKRIYSNNEEFIAVQVEYAKFSGCLDAFFDSDSMTDRGNMEPKIWWILHGSSTPLLHKLAMKLLGQPSSSSCVERNWSTYSFIHSLKRNEMTPQRAEDLIFVHTNLHLFRGSGDYREGGSKMWDLGGDQHDSFEDIGVLEIANLLLDEPVLETMIFTDEGLETMEGNDVEGGSIVVESN
ncbi:LOW QUALITY PROTEIN: Dimer_Tnp_hAT domain-containing protein, partial [Cephalotus follicularis]